MKSFLTIIPLIVCLLLASCSNQENTFKEVDSANKEDQSQKPTLKAEVTVNGNSALVYVDTSMKISKDMYGKKKKTGEGHIHMYVDNGEKQGVTSSPVRIENLTKGDHKVKISLHNNDHTPYDVTETLTFTVQ
ncbi:hypothetical protein KUV80_12375 [Fictibacillus nanhaiensis]|uniref:hypothetical protein n=1 Tax=Fictibacillus nanhaiensis TaxID=742169 RepID=UPI001C98404E|nr:hypothetical protein [Fictibacillus nanhaiensis]MBY6037461.1 hypothetical protein [Fictibacillus nanhaiensis]